MVCVNRFQTRWYILSLDIKGFAPNMDDVQWADPQHTGRLRGDSETFAKNTQLPGFHVFQESHIFWPIFLGKCLFFPWFVQNPLLYDFFVTFQRLTQLSFHQAFFWEISTLVLDSASFWVSNWTFFLNDKLRQFSFCWRKAVIKK